MPITKTIAGNSYKRVIQVLEVKRDPCIICQKQTQQLFVYVLERKDTTVLPLVVIVAWGTTTHSAFYGWICNECNTVLSVVPKSENKKLEQKYEYSVGLFSKSHERFIGERKRAINLRFPKTVEACTTCGHIKDMHWKSIVEKERGC